MSDDNEFEKEVLARRDALAKEALANLRNLSPSERVDELVFFVHKIGVSEKFKEKIGQMLADLYLTPSSPLDVRKTTTHPLVLKFLGVAAMSDRAQNEGRMHDLFKVIALEISESPEAMVQIHHLGQLETFKRTLEIPWFNGTPDAARMADLNGRLYGDTLLSAMEVGVQRAAQAMSDQNLVIVPAGPESEDYLYLKIRIENDQSIGDDIKHVLAHRSSVLLQDENLWQLESLCLTTGDKRTTQRALRADAKAGGWNGDKPLPLTNDPDIRARAAALTNEGVKIFNEKSEFKIAIAPFVDGNEISVPFGREVEFFKVCDRYKRFTTGENGESFIEHWVAGDPYAATTDSEIAAHNAAVQKRQNILRDYRDGRAKAAANAVFVNDIKRDSNSDLADAAKAVLRGRGVKADNPMPHPQVIAGPAIPVGSDQLLVCGDPVGGAAKIGLAAISENVDDVETPEPRPSSPIMPKIAGALWKAIMAPVRAYRAVLRFNEYLIRSSLELELEWFDELEIRKDLFWEQRRARLPWYRRWLAILIRRGVPILTGTAICGVLHIAGY